MTEPPPGGYPPPPQLPIPSGIAWELPEPAPDEDDGDQLDDGERFGATYSPGGFQPVPYVSIGGVQVARGTTAGKIVGQIVVDGLTVRWGRQKVMEQPEISTAQLVLFDATETWATGRQLIGQEVRITWEDDLPGTGLITRTLFVGRIQRVKLGRKTVRQADGTEVDGALVTLPLVSIINDLANIKPKTAWPEETVEARRNRLNALIANVLPGGLLVRSYWYTPNVEPYGVTSQRSLWDHIVALYDSTGADRLSHWPTDGLIRNMVRKDFTVRGLAGLWWDQTTDPQGPGRAGKGAYIRTYSVAPVGGPGGTPHYLDGAALQDDPAESLEQGPEQRISRVQVSNPDGATAPTYTERTATFLIPTVNETTEGVRQASVDSVLTWNAWADLAGKDLVEMASQEGTAWRLPSLSWDTSRTDGFETYQQASLHLLGVESTSIVFLQRTWLPRFGIRPIVGIIGGVVSYRRGHWRLELETSPAITQSAPQHAITWEEIDDGTAEYEVQWWDEEHPRGLHESVTYEDLAYCSTGVGVVTIPPDVGWDQVMLR